MLRDATRRVSAGAPSLFAQAAGWGREPCVSSARGAVGSGTLVARTSSPPAAGAPAGARWFAKPVRRPTRKVKSGAAAWGEKDGKGKALAPIANAWTEVTCTETGKTYWQGLDAASITPSPPDSSSPTQWLFTRARACVLHVRQTSPRHLDVDARSRQREEVRRHPVRKVSSEAARRRPSATVE